MDKERTTERRVLELCKDYLTGKLVIPKSDVLIAIVAVLTDDPEAKQILFGLGY